MSAITGVSGSNANLLQWLTQAEAGNADDESTIPALAASQLQAESPDAEAATTDTEGESSTDLEKQIRSAVSSALQTAEQSGSVADLKTVVHNSLVQVLKNHGIDPQTFKSTTDSSSGPSSASGTQQSPIDTSTRTVLAQVLAALSAATASSNPLTQLMPSSQNNDQDLLGFLFDSGQ
jgi:hypothetical protein